MKPKIWIDIKVKTPEGIVLQELSEEGHSWVRNFYNLHSMLMVDSPILSVVPDVIDQDNNKLSEGPFYLSAGDADFMANHFWQGGNGISLNNGIRLGASRDPFYIFYQKIDDLITHGTGPGQLFHHTMPYERIIPAPDNSYYDMVHRRSFENLSGETITFGTVGLIASLQIQSSIVDVVMAYDVLSVPVEIPPGTLIDCTYRLHSPFFYDILEQHGYKMGDAGSGGYYFYSPTGPKTHLKYTLILASVDMGLSEPLYWAEDNLEAIGATDEYYGYDNTQKMIEAQTPAGLFVANANENKYYGYDDWYIPAKYECEGIATKFNKVCAYGEETPIDDYLWTSTEIGNSAYRFDVNADISSSINKNSGSYKVRLVRRIPYIEFEMYG